jgi:hypothetical protein
MSGKGEDPHQERHGGGTTDQEFFQLPSAKALDGLSIVSTIGLAVCPKAFAQNMFPIN